jgi:hypothetical protein
LKSVLDVINSYWKVIVVNVSECPNLFGGDFSFKKEEKTFRALDECSLVMNNLLHEIKSEDSCKVMCFEECKIREMTYQNYSFQFKENSCHDCFCTCK